jgi:hypothetical protein
MVSSDILFFLRCSMNLATVASLGCSFEPMSD